PTTAEDGSYVVVLRDAPLATGPTARATDQGRLDTTSESATAYTDRLLEQQDQVLSEVAADPTYHYTTALNGFAVPLTAAEVSALRQRPDVRSVTLDEPRQLLSDPASASAGPQLPATDIGPGLLGLSGPGGAWAQLGGADRAGRGVVVGILDTGISWRNPSFSATGMPGKPAGFTGACDSGQDAAGWPARACTAKIVSARYFVQGLRSAGAELARYESVSPLDVNGHGSHVSSTAAGRQTSAKGFDGRSASISGMAPMAHVAAYKVCWETVNPWEGGCYMQDSIAAVDRAVRDGVDVLNFSISGDPYGYDDPVDEAFKNAAAAGVFVAAAGGNSGSDVEHTVPWLTTVAAAVHRSSDGAVPSIAGFSARGPVNAAGNPGLQTILKPDLGAPGVEVFAAVEDSEDDKPQWDRISGTSMASPHVAGLAALQMQAHPAWSPMAVKSSLMTSTRRYATRGSNNPHVGGAGFVAAKGMLATPLVFDSGLADWNAFVTKPSTGTRLNQPSVHVPQLPATAPTTVTRTVTNVSGQARTFRAAADSPSTFPMRVRPSVLTIPAGGSAQVSIQMANTGAAAGAWQKGAVTWTTSGLPAVRIPVLGRGQVFAPKVGRLGGANRFDTARLISAQFPGGADTVYLASGLSFADALAGSPAAARGQVPSTLTSSGRPAPVLLVGPDGIPTETRAALSSLKPRSIVALGGQRAVPEAILRGLRSQGYAVDRVAGEDRYDTAAKIALLSGSDVPLVYVASGADRSYPDALAGASAAARDDAPVLLTKQDRIPDSVRAALDELRPRRIVVLGGDGAVSDGVFRQLGADQRLGGTNRWETAAAVAATFGADPGNAYVAYGLNWPDALAGSVLAGSQSAPVLITGSTSIPAPVATQLNRLSPQRLTILGGTGVVSTTVADTLNRDYGRWIIE
ncbi:MAG: cell wall-binding repeat-containing protein, partial [Actinobacteria bacterium]|nr:cell wall-binding repeat-containing protein [Actinomycetota bacterium]